MKPTKEKIYLDLSKCTEEERKKLSLSLKLPINSIKLFPYLTWNDRYSRFDQFQSNSIPKGKTELTYPEFIKLFEGGEEEKEVQKLKKQIDLYKECFELFIPTDKWDEANEFLSINGNPLAKHLSRVQKEVEKKPKF